MSTSTPAPQADQHAAIVAAVVAGLRDQLQLRQRPQSTYRVQFRREFGFKQATDLVAYWDMLGITDGYASPYFKASPGSTHGYDIVDHNLLNPELGTADDFNDFVDRLRGRGMGHILDFVPNHMGVGNNENAWWQDVLENGPSSRYSNFFDIDWRPLKEDLEHKVLLPVLGGQFGRVLEARQFNLLAEQGGFFIEYYGRRFPVGPRSFQQILRHRLETLPARLPTDDPHHLEYHSILTAIGHLPTRMETMPEKLEEREREKEVIKRRLARLCDESPVIRGFLAENVELFNGKEGDPASFDLLDTLLQDQSYRLSFWRVASDEINYRRFFDINELAAICMERREVFDASHRLVLQLLKEGRLDGLRLDHADGLYDPHAYLWQLQEARFLQLCEEQFSRIVSESVVTPPGEDVPAPVTWPDVEPRLREEFAKLRQADPFSELVQPLYLVVEKILENTEELPEDWPIHGSTGYDFLNDVNGLFVDGENRQPLEATYAKFIDRIVEFSELGYDAKRLILKVSMSSELHTLGNQLDRISERNRWTQDFTLHGLIQALREVIACFPVYRTYTVGEQVLDRDRKYVERAISAAKHRNPAVSGEVYDFIQSVLLHENNTQRAPEERALRQQFVGRFQQFTGPVMAKSVEDTTFYRYHILVSLNEVGGSPETMGNLPEEFHRQNQERQRLRPFGMLATSTHDTKRAEDVRARINLLSEIPGEWKQQVTRWAKLNQKSRLSADGEVVPSRNDEYLLYQTLVGTWPLETPDATAIETYVERIQEYMAKAGREAKVHSSWIAPNEAYEQALRDFVKTILTEPKNKFRAEFEPFVKEIAQLGLWNSLSQTLLKLTCPGVPDTYQGTELWDFSLVDPDNRRPVDYTLRKMLLESLLPALDPFPEAVAQITDRRAFAADLVSNARDGRIKLFVTAAALRLRRALPRLFTRGEYIPLSVTGARARHVCAFARRTTEDHAGEQAAIVIVPRLVAQLMEQAVNSNHNAPVGAGVWEATTINLPADLQQHAWLNIFTGESLAPGPLSLADALQTFPVALLRAQQSM